MPLSRLLYVSHCALPEERATAEHIRELAERSARRNAAADLTGSLLHLQSTFIQVLEGPGPAVERTFEKICCDFRHQDIKLIDMVPVKDRIFGAWNMALMEADAEAAIPLRDDLEEIRFLVGINAREAVASMRRVLDQHAA